MIEPYASIVLPAMTQPQPDSVPLPQPQKEEGVFTRILGLSGLIAAALFFTGYVYRWAYYSYFQLDIATLDFPVQTFPILAIQVFAGDPGRIVQTLLALVAIAAVTLPCLWLLKKLRTSLMPRHSRRLADWLRGLGLLFSYFLGEAVVMIGILVILFWFSRSQGWADARRDAYNQSSTLPTVVLMTPERKAVLGRLLAESTPDPPLAYRDQGLGQEIGYRFFGDKQLFNQVYRKEDTDSSNPQQSRVWRILLSRNKWIYLFAGVPDLPNSKTEDRYPLVVAIQEGGDQQIILAPSKGQLQKSP